MAAKALVTIAGIALPTPATYIGGTYDIVDATRNVQGITIGSIVREDVGKVEMTMEISHTGAMVNHIKTVQFGLWWLVLQLGRILQSGHGDMGYSDNVCW